MLSRSNKTGGFSILEMVVVTGIFVMVTGIVMANLPKFRNQASLDLTAQAVALSIREAQVYGTATKVSGNTYPSYGVHFSLSNNTANKNFVLFADDGNKVFDSGREQISEDGCGQEGSECLERYALDGPFYILAICANDGVNEDCTNFQEGDISLDLVYKRPFPEPSICLDGGLSCNYTNATIIIGSPENSERKLVKVWNNGQISVTNPPAAQ